MRGTYSGGQATRLFRSTRIGAVVLTDLVSAHLSFLGGTEPKSRWVIMHFEFAAKKPGGK